jgi:hypothetical protein
MKRDREGFPLEFELPSRCAEAVADEVLRLRAEKNLGHPRSSRSKASSLSVLASVAKLKTLGGVA